MINLRSGKNWRVSAAHPSVYSGWVGASRPRPTKSHRKKLKMVNKKIINFSLS